VEALTSSLRCRGDVYTAVNYLASLLDRPIMLHTRRLRHRAPLIDCNATMIAIKSIVSRHLRFSTIMESTSAIPILNYCTDLAMFSGGAISARRKLMMVIQANRIRYKNQCDYPVSISALHLI
jgi:hypothetical protein